MLLTLIAIAAVAGLSALLWTTLTDHGRVSAVRVGLSLRPPVLGETDRWIDLDQLPPVLDPAEAELARLDAELAEGNRTEVNTWPCPGELDIAVDVSDFAELEGDTIPAPELPLYDYDSVPPTHTGIHGREPVESLARAVGDGLRPEIPPPPRVARVPHWLTDEEEI